jgi:AbrB family looped-hinge helix DNA binding protein
MNEVTVSSGFRIVIPRKARDALRLKPGQKLHVIGYENRLVLIPDRPIQEARGSLRNTSPKIDREEEALA